MYESSLLHIFYNIQKYTFTPSFRKRFEIMVAATLEKNLDPPMPKRGKDSYLQENQELLTTCILSMTVKLMLWISNLFLYLIEITHFQKYIDGLLTEM